jgi:chromosome segregation ATPase
MYNAELDDAQRNLSFVSVLLSSVADDIEYYKNNTTGYEDVIGQFEIQVEELAAAIENLYGRIESSLQFTAYLANLIYQLSEDIWEEQAAVNAVASIRTDPVTKTDNGVEEGINDLEAKIDELARAVMSCEVIISEIECAIGAFVEELEYIVAEVQTIKAFEQETTAALEGALVELEELEQNAQSLSLNLEEYSQEYSVCYEYHSELCEKIQICEDEMRWLLEFLANDIQTEEDWMNACDSYEWLRDELMALLNDLNELLKM